MTQATAQERAAIVMAVLGDSVRDAVLAELRPETAGRLRAEMQRLEETPAPPRKLDEALDELDRTLRFALKSQPAGADDTNDDGIEKPPEDESNLRLFSEKNEEEVEFIRSDDLVADLSRLQPYQLAGALQQEMPMTVAMVLGTLEGDLGGEVLRLLPEALQSQTFLEMQSDATPARILLERIARSTRDRAIMVSPDDISTGKPSSDERMASLLRAMSRKERANMLDALTEKDEEAANRVRGMIYQFDDLMRVQLRTLQKILGDLDTPTLAKSLKDADPAMIDRIRGCMSQRAWSTVGEELEMAASTSSDDVEAARNEIVQIMVQLDQAGDLQMEE